MPLNKESNGTSFSSKALLSIPDLEEKEKLSALFIRRWEEVGGRKKKTRRQRCFHSVLMGAGASERLAVVAGFDFSVCLNLFVSGWMSSHVQDNQAPERVGRSKARGREEAVNGPYVASRAHSSPLTGEMGGRTGQR